MNVNIEKKTKTETKKHKVNSKIHYVATWLTSNANTQFALYLKK